MGLRGESKNPSDIFIGKSGRLEHDKQSTGGESAQGLANIVTGRLPVHIFSKNNNYWIK